MAMSGLGISGAAALIAYLMFLLPLTVSELPYKLQIAQAQPSANVSKCYLTPNGRALQLVAYLLLAALAVVCIQKTKKGPNQSRPVYLLDFACYRPPLSLRLSRSKYMYATRMTKTFGDQGYTPEAFKFQERITYTNGLSDYVFGPPGMHQDPFDSCDMAGNRECQMVLAGAITELLDRTGVSPEEFDYVIVNSSLYNPDPSHSTMVAARFKLRPDVQRFDLGGMGCSAGITSIDLANRLLKCNPNRTALVLSTENITKNQYTGNDRDKLIPNTLFRLGAVAAIMTNKPEVKKECKYELKHVGRVHLGADQIAYNCVYHMEDAYGKKAVKLTKDIVSVAAKALQKNLTELGPSVLPYSELLRFTWSMLLKTMGVRRKAYVPDFRKAFKHFAFHAGGRGVIEGLGGQLGLDRRALEPSFSALYFYGNTSSASYWYGFGYAESKHGMRKGDRLWQVGFGSGFKVGSCVWEALKTFKDTRHKAWHDATPEKAEQMWEDLAGMGVVFVDGILPSYEAKKKLAAKEKQDKENQQGEVEKVEAEIEFTRPSHGHQAVKVTM